MLECWFSSLLDLFLLFLVIAYELSCFQRLTTMETYGETSEGSSEENHTTSVKDLEDSTSESNLETATNNKVSLESATYNKDIESESYNEEELGVYKKDNLEGTYNKEDLERSYNKDNLERSYNKDNLESATYDGDNFESGNTAFSEETDMSDGDPIPRYPIKIPDLLSNTKMSKVYEVNGSTFVEEETWSSHNDDTLARYELYKVMKMPKDCEDDGEDEDMTTLLDVNIQQLQQGGVIINSNVFLWDAHWHTMALVDGNVFRCAVCQLYCDRANCSDHIESVAHLRNLASYKPLKRFDLSIVRKINENLHCGVCNDIIDVIDFKTHENSKSHEGNLLTAINKVSDIMYDSDIHRNTSAERKFHSSDRNTNSHDINVQDYNRNIQSHYRNIENNNRNITSDRNVHTLDTESGNNNNDFCFDVNAINNNNLNVYEESSEYDDDEEYSFENEEYITPSQGVSYASMASKPTIELPKYLKIDLGTKQFRVKFESWHMIIKIELNKFYCMVCNKTDHIRFKSQHCIGCEHLERLARCTIVKAFEDYLIRKVDDKLYHCGHCNNLQYQNQMIDHIGSAHPKKNKNIIDTTTNSPLKTAKKCPKTAEKNKTATEPKIKTEREKTAIIDKNIEFRTETKIDPDFDIFGDLTLSPFGTELKISALSFNFITAKDGEYYCAICDKPCTDVKVHVEELDHVELMVVTPFIRPFKCNLTRAVRGMLHCSLCNELITVSEIYQHNMDQPHTTALAAALGMKITQKPTNTKKIDNKLNQKPDTVPPKQPLTTGLTNPPPKQPLTTGLTNPPPKQPLTTGLTNPPPKQPLTTGLTNPPPKQPLTTGLTNPPPKQPLTTGLTNPPPKQPLTTGLTNPPPKQPLTTGLTNPPPKQPLTTGLTNPPPKTPSPNLNTQSLKKEPQSSNLLKISTQIHIPTNADKSSAIPNKLKIETNNNKMDASQNASQTLNSGQNCSAKLNFNAGSNYYGPTQPNSGQNYQNSNLNLPYPGQNFNPQNFPSIYNPMLPLPPLNPQAINPFLGAPLNYTNFNAPRPPYPFPYMPGALLSPNLTNQNISNQPNITAENQNIFKPETQKNARSKTPVKKNIESSNTTKVNNNIKYVNDNIKTGNDNIKTGYDNIKYGNDNIKTGNDNIKSGNDPANETIESIVSQSDDDEFKEFDEEEMVFVKLKATYFKITNLSYNTLVYLDNGIRHCFVCSMTVRTISLHKHIESREHMENIAKNKFLDKYGVQLFRQMYLMYHCAICNVLMTRKEIKLHLDWPVHIETYDISHVKINKKKRKALKSGIKEYVVDTQKEAIFHNVNEPKATVVAAYQIVPNLVVNKADALEIIPNKGSKATVVKKHKMIIMNNVVMKVDFDRWHGITSSKNVTKCIICQLEIRQAEVFDHVETGYHGVALGKTFEKTYYPALVRKINENTVNCMFCNLELPNNEYMIHEHIIGRKHNKNQESIANESSNSDSYTDCYEDYLTL